MKRLNLSQHAFVDLPDPLPLTDEGKLNIMFQYRWSASAKPSEKSKYVKAVVVYAEHEQFNTGGSGELGTADFINKSIEKILKETGTELDKWGCSSYSGGGLGFYNLFKNKDKLISLPDGVILSDSTYGGLAVIKTWSELAIEYLGDTLKRFVLLHTRSLEEQFSSTTKTANAIIKDLKILDNKVNLDEINDNPDFWKDWPSKPTTWTQKGGVIILDTNLTHGEAGKIVPTLWDCFLTNWY